MEVGDSHKGGFILSAVLVGYLECVGIVRCRIVVYVRKGFVKLNYGICGEVFDDGVEFMSWWHKGVRDMFGYKFVCVCVCV